MMDVEVRKRKLHALLVLHGESSKDLAAALGITSATLWRKMNMKKGEFTESDIMKIYKRYQLTPEEVADIFFSK